MDQQELKNEQNESVEASRRKFLKTAGKIAIYTPPAMMIMSQPSYATGKTSGGHYNHEYKRRQRSPISKKKKHSFLRNLLSNWR